MCPWGEEEGKGMRVLSLQQSTLIKLAVTFWTRDGMEKVMTKQTNGIVQMENALEELKKLTVCLPLSINLKNRLVEVVERVGYELYIFMSRSPVNILESNLDLSKDIVWSPHGVIQEKLTYGVYINKNHSQSLMNFKCACLVCIEDEIGKIWQNLSGPDKQELECRTYSLLVAYWVHFLENKVNDFISIYGYSILGFQPYRSIQYNMTVYCLNLNMKPALEYFFERVPDSEKQFLRGNNSTSKESKESIHFLLLQYTLRNPRQEYFRFICSFLEMPTSDYTVYDLVVQDMPDGELKEFINYLLRQVNLFGDLHYNIFRRVIKMSRPEVKNMLISTLDFYVLTLLGKGRFETFEYLLTAEAKSNLHQLLCNRLKESKGLSLFYTILKNNHKHLLIKCFDYLSSSEEDEMFFKEHLSSMLDGSQYDSVR